MRAVKKSAALVVRPRSIRRQSLILSLAAFCLTVAGVYFISQNISQKNQAVKGSKAVAVVDLKVESGQDGLLKNSLLGSVLTQKMVENRIFSPSFMQPALRECGIDLFRDIGKGNSHINKDTKIGTVASIISPEQIRNGLSFSVKPGTTAGEYQITMVLTLPQSEDANRIVRALADRFVHEYRTFWALEVRKIYLAEMAKADRAQQLHLEAVEKLQTYNISQKEQSLTEIKQPQTEIASPAAIITSDNESWVELNNKLASLRREEVELLENKTAEHPDVQYLRGRIADFEQQLALTSCFKSESTASGATQQTIPSAENNVLRLDNNRENPIRDKGELSTGNLRQSESSETLKELQLAADRTELEYMDLARHSQQIFESSSKLPGFAIQVNPIAIAKPASKPARGLIELMLFSGLAMAVGIGVFSTGVASEPSLASIADMELLLPVPIIGIVPSKDLYFDPVKLRLRQLLYRRMLIICGVLLVLGCIGGVYWFVGV